MVQKTLGIDNAAYTIIQLRNKQVNLMVPRIKGHIQGFWKYKSPCSAKLYQLKNMLLKCLALLGVFGLGLLEFFSENV